MKRVLDPAVLSLMAVWFLLSSVPVSKCQDRFLHPFFERPPDSYALQTALMSQPSHAIGVRQQSAGFDSIPLNDSVRYDSAGSFPANPGRHSLILSVAGETALGLMAGTVLSIPSGYIAVGLSGEEGWGAMGPGIIGMYVGYAVGSSLGVYAGGGGQSRRVSLAGTLGSGLAGAAAGALVFAISGRRGPQLVLPLVLPLVASIIYVELSD
jgi:hypothetical protein